MHLTAVAPSSPMFRATPVLPATDATAAPSSFLHCSPCTSVLAFTLLCRVFATFIAYRRIVALSDGQTPRLKALTSGVGELWMRTGGALWRRRP
ncbi:hypothetical protein HN51_061744 [Arachis hypogaea]